MPAAGKQIVGPRFKWKLHCWTCGNPFEAVRETAMMCSAKCKQQRSRAHRKTGKYPERHPNAHRTRVKSTPWATYIR